MEFLVRDLQNQNTEKEKRMVQLAAALDALSQKTAAAELRAVEYAKTRIEALEKDFIQSRLADRVANLEATSGPSLSLRVSELESALQFTGALVRGIPGDGRCIKAAFQMVEAELDTVKGQSVHKDELSKQLASADAAYNQAIEQFRAGSEKLRSDTSQALMDLNVSASAAQKLILEIAAEVQNMKLGASYGLRGCLLAAAVLRDAGARSGRSAALLRRLLRAPARGRSSRPMLWVCGWVAPRN